MALIKTRSRGITNNAIGPDQFDLTANYPFTGTVSGTNGMTKLIELNETTSTDYASDTVIFNFDAYTSTYHSFFFAFSMMLTGNGNVHAYLTFHDAGSGPLTGRTVGRGWIDSNTAATPSTGTGSAHRWGFRCAGPGIHHTCAGNIFNGQRGDNDYDASAQFQSNWHYSGVGNVTAKHSFIVSGSGDQISRLAIDLDPADSGTATDFSAKIKGSLWGIS